MKAKPIPFCAFLLVFSLLAAQSAATLPADGQAAEIEALLPRLMALELAPGMAVVVVRDREAVYCKGFGYADVENARRVTADTVFYIASATKPFFGTAAAILDQRKDFKLEKSLGSYLPGAKYHEGIDPQRITIRDLLTHTHGISNGGPVTFRLAFSGQHTPALLRELLRHHGPASSGRSFNYGNIGFNIAAMAMEEAVGTTWKQVLRREVLDPLGMSSTTALASEVRPERLAQPYRQEASGFSRLHFAKADSNMHSAGGMMTTANDLGLWLIANLNQGRVYGKQRLPKEAVALAQQPVAKQNSAFGPFGRKGYGLGWHSGPYDNETMLHHFGGFSGFHAHMSFLPERGVGVAVLTNTSLLGGQLAIMAASSIYDILLDRPDRKERLDERITEGRERAAELRGHIKEDRRRRAARPQTLPHPLEAYTGTFDNDQLGQLTITVVKDRLEVTMGRLWSAVEVYDSERNALRVELTGGGTVLLFDIPDGASRASGLSHRGFQFRRIE